MNEGAVKIVVIAVFFGAGFLWQVAKRQRQARRVQDTARSKAVSAPQGLVELQGFAWPAEETIPGKNGFEAVYYAFKLQKLVSRGSGKSRTTEWVTVSTRMHELPFYLLDATGLVMVDPISAEFTGPLEEVRSWKSLSETEKLRIQNSVLTENVSDFPPRTAFFGLFGSQFRVVESEIAVGSPLYVNGTFSTQNGSDQQVSAPGLSVFYDRVYDSTSLAVRKRSGQLDTNHDGKVSIDESKFGYAMIARTAIATTTAGALGERTFKLCGSVFSNDERKLLIANAHEEHLVEALEKNLWLRFAGGAAILSFGITLAVLMFQHPEYFEKPKYNLTPKRLVSSVGARGSEPMPTRFHRECVGGNATACEELLRNQDSFRLKKSQIIYYKFRACELGSLANCNGN